jgi:amino acid transporter
MPRVLAAIAPSTGTPWVAVVLSAAFYAAFSAFSFKDLIVINIWLYSLPLLIELAAFVHLRRAEPHLPRPWRVPGGMAVAVIVAAIPSALALLAMATAGWMNTVAGVIGALTGPVAWFFVTNGVRQGQAAR